MSPSDFSVFKNFHREIHSWISRSEQDVKQLSGFHCQKWLNMPANFFLKFQATDEKTAKNLRGILFAAPVCYTNSSLALADIYTYISLRFTQSNSPTHTKFSFSFRNTRISRISRQSVSVSSCKPPTQRKHVPPRPVMQVQLQVLGPAWKSVDGLPVIFFRRWWHLLLTDMPKVRVGIDQCGFSTFHRGASARTARVTAAKTC